MADLLFEVEKDSNVRKALTIRSGDKGRRGASGRVFELSSEPGKAIKDYHDKERLKFEPKVRTMIKVKYNRPHVDRFDLAWPEALVVDIAGTFRGFKMPFYGNGWVDLESLMQASEAQKKYRLGERHRLMIGANLAMAVKALHDLKVYCIDLKPENVRVNLSNMSVAIIDCDGMSVVDIGVPNSQRFYADKFTPEFTPPENLNLRPHKYRDEETHDRFALATIIFMLLNRGLHPFMGIMSFDEPGTETIAGKIKNNLYPYGTEKGRITPHQDSLYPFLPDETKALFDRAFSVQNIRPPAEEWLNHLNGLALQSKSCENDEHHINYPKAGCPICKRSQSATAAPQWAALVASSVRPTPSPIRVAPPPTPKVAPPAPPLLLSGFVTGTSTSRGTVLTHGAAAPKSPGRSLSPTEIKLSVGFVAAVGMICVYWVGGIFQSSPQATRPNEQVPSKSGSTSRPSSSATTVDPTPPKPPPPVAPPKPSIETVMRSSGLVGVWASDCRQGPSTSNEYFHYSVTQSSEGTMTLDNGNARSISIIRDAEGAAGNKINLDFEQLPLRTPQHVALLMEGNRYRTWTNINNGQSIVNAGISSSRGQPTAWRVRCGSSPTANGPPNQRCTAGNVIWGCGGMRCGRMPGTCQ